jgi:hypothetical protein
MPISSHPSEALAVLSPPVAAYVEATNNFDLERLLALFADDALVNDQLRDCWGSQLLDNGRRGTLSLKAWQWK